MDAESLQLGCRPLLHYDPCVRRYLHILVENKSHVTVTRPACRRPPPLQAAASRDAANPSTESTLSAHPEATITGVVLS